MPAMMKSAFQRENTCLSLCPRQIPAVLLTPVSSSRTSRAFNSEVNVRRLGDCPPFQGLVVPEVSRLSGFWGRLHFQKHKPHMAGPFERCAAKSAQ